MQEKGPGIPKLKNFLNRINQEIFNSIYLS